MLYGWGFAPAFLTSPTLSNGEEEETLEQKKKNFSFGHNIFDVIVDFQRNTPMNCFFCFFAFRLEKEHIGGILSTYEGKLAKPGFMDIINDNQQKFQPYAAMVERAYENLNLEFVDNQDAHGEIENDETGKPIYSEYT